MQYPTFYYIRTHLSHCSEVVEEVAMCCILKEDGHGGPIGNTPDQLYNVRVYVNRNLLHEFNLIVEGI